MKRSLETKTSDDKKGESTKRRKVEEEQEETKFDQFEQAFREEARRCAHAGKLDVAFKRAYERLLGKPHPKYQGPYRWDQNEFLQVFRFVRSLRMPEMLEYIATRMPPGLGHRSTIFLEAAGFQECDPTESKEERRAVWLACIRAFEVLWERPRSQWTSLRTWAKGGEEGDQFEKNFLQRSDEGESRELSQYCWAECRAGELVSTFARTCKTTNRPASDVWDLCLLLAENWPPCRDIQKAKKKCKTEPCPCERCWQTCHCHVCRFHRPPKYSFVRGEEEEEEKVTPLEKFFYRVAWCAPTLQDVVDRCPRGLAFDFDEYPDFAVLMDAERRKEYLQWAVPKVGTSNGGEKQYVVEALFDACIVEDLDYVYSCTVEWGKDEWQKMIHAVLKQDFYLPEQDDLSAFVQWFVNKDFVFDKTEEWDNAKLARQYRQAFGFKRVCAHLAPELAKEVMEFCLEE